MISRKFKELAFYAFYSESGIGVTGLSVTINIYKNGVLTITDGEATEVGDGLYKYVLGAANVDATGEYVGVFKTDSDLVTQKHLPVIWEVVRDDIIRYRRRYDTELGGV
jgi:hypothetical protein